MPDDREQEETEAERAERRRAEKAAYLEDKLAEQEQADAETEAGG